MDWSKSQIKIFRTLLYCYPAEFRHEYGIEMAQLFEDRLEREPHWRLWADTIADVGTSAVREHLAVLFADVKHGVRLFASDRWFTAITVLVLAVGVAASVAVFSLCDAVLFRSLPYEDPSRLVYLWSPNHNFQGVPEEMGPVLADFLNWQKRSHSFSSVASFEPQATSLVRRSYTARLQGAFVSGTFFGTLGVPAQLGRTIAPEDDQYGRDKVVAISDRLWRSEFHADPRVVGRVVQWDREKATIIGVLPRGFGFPLEGDVPYEHLLSAQTDVWAPGAYSLGQKTDRTNLNTSVDAVARLRRGVSPQVAQQELERLQRGVQDLYVPMWRGFSALVRPMVETIIGPVKEMFWLLLGAVGLVMLIAIANTANLLLARTAARAHELGIRTALGAERGRIVRQILTESVLLSGAGGALGIALAYALVRVLVRLNPGGIPRFGDAHIDSRVLVFAVVLSVGAGALAGLAPAWVTGEVNLHSILRGGGRGIATGFVRGRFALIAAEIALSVVLLSSAGLLLRSYINLAAMNHGFSPDTVTFGIPLDGRYDTPAKGIQFNADILARFQHIPGVRYAGGTDAVPLTPRDSVTYVEIFGQGRTKEMVENRSVTPDYRKAIGAALLLGRDFSARDVDPKEAVALVNAAFVRKYLPRREPTGTRFRIGMGDLSSATWYTVVGVIANVNRHALDEQAVPEIWTPYGQGGQFALACASSTDQVMRAVRSIVHSVDPALTLEDVHTMRERVTASNARRTFQTALIAGFSVLALLLALAGLYGLMSFLVRHRTAEIGVRLALGSPRRRVIGMIVGQAMRVTLVGLLIGLGCSFAVAHVMKSWLFAVKPIDPTTFAGVALATLVVAICGSLFPAWSATRIDPLAALRQE